MSAKSQDDYVGLIPSQHRFLLRFPQVISEMVRGAVEQQAEITSWEQKFDLDTAVGAQLDLIGQWIGVSRNLTTQLTGVYLTWDGLEAEGWDSGLWQGPFDPDSGLIALPDENYRRLLRLWTRLNRWDGSREQFLSIWSDIFPADRIGVIQDNYDMTITIGYQGAPLGQVELAIVLTAVPAIKSLAVGVEGLLLPINDLLLFAWDAESGPGRAFGGWEEAQWIEPSPIPS